MAKNSSIEEKEARVERGWLEQAKKQVKREHGS